jgi:hypothetical protein
MPPDNADLAHVAIDFPRLSDDTAVSCPVALGDLLRYLADEAPGGERLSEPELHFVRTAQVTDRRYWRFREPDGGELAYATVSQGDDGQVVIGYEADYYGLSPEQFMLGDYHGVF